MRKDDEQVEGYEREACVDLLEFERLLAELRVVRTDHQFVEAKTAARSLPETSHETLSAFANAGGGKFILGLDEAGGDFIVTGVEDAAQMQQNLQALCAEMEPALRPQISVIDFEGKSVIVADIPPVAPHLRPCYRKSLGDYAGSFIRVGDADQSWTATEVDEARAHKVAHADYSARPAPSSITLDSEAFAEFAVRARLVARNADLDDDALKHRYGVVADEDQLTIAGALSLGDSPETALGPARMTYKVIGAKGAPPKARFQGDHLEGTVGELLDQSMDAFERDLRTFQIVDQGSVRDELEVPREALREIVSNSLMHRSFSTEQEARSISIEITDEAVVVMSPGSLFSGADLARLGLDAMGGSRNASLIRICDFVQTPRGDRIVENHASGIRAADHACREADAMPPLFIDRPAMFHAVLLRRSTDPDRALAMLRARGVEPTPELVRLVGVATVLEETRTDTVGVSLSTLVMDARLGARALSPATEEDAAHYLRHLEEARVLERRVARHTPFWTVHRDLLQASLPAAHKQAKAETPKSESKKGDRLFPLLAALDAAKPNGLTSSAVGTAIGVSSPSSRKRWLDKAMDANWIEPSSDNAFDRTRTFTLTAPGKQALAAHRRRASGS